MSGRFWTFTHALITGKGYWLGLFVLGLAMEGVALYYQHVLGDEPCQLCIHVRIWVAAFTLLALLMCLLPKNHWLNMGGHLLAVACMVGFWERCKVLIDVELGRGNTSCGIYLNFPEWFALDRWMPSVFEVRNFCGQTPEMWFGITMAEMLMAASTVLLAGTVLALFMNLQRQD